MIYFISESKKIKSIYTIICIMSSIIFSKNLQAGVMPPEYTDMKNKISNMSYDSIVNCSPEKAIECTMILGRAYQLGADFKDHEIKSDSDKAILYFSKISASSPQARYLLSDMIRYYYPKESDALLLSAANEGEFNSVYALGHPYYHGKTNKELLENIKWVKVLIDKYPDFPHDERGVVGSLYLLMTPPDYKEAIYWLTRASDEGNNLGAQSKLAKLYAEGTGVKKDLVKAYMYYDLGGTGDNDAKQEIEKLMTPDQIDQAIALSHQWQDEHHSYRPGYSAWGNTDVRFHWQTR